MATQFQNRLVGTIILVAVGVIFFPEILDGDKKKTEPLFASIPLQPSLEQRKPRIEVAEQLNDEETSNKGEASSSENKTSNINTDATPAQIKAPVTQQIEFTDSAWVIQLGYFGNIDNVNALVKKLRKAGYQAHIEAKLGKNNDLTGVFIGPELSKQHLQKQLPKLLKLTKLKGKLIPFKALEPGK